MTEVCEARNHNMVFERDTGPSSGFPLEYKRWTVTKNGIREEYVIQDLPPVDDQLALDMMVESFIRDEPTCKSTNAKACPHARREMREFWSDMVAERVSLACYQIQPDGGRRLVGVNICYVSEKGEPKPDVSQLKSDTWRRILSTLLLMDDFRPHEALAVDRFLSAAGLFVLPELRGRGLAVEMVKARQKVCEAVGLVASATVFTALASQHIAAKCGFKVLGEIQYADLRARGWHYPDIDTPSVKLMGIRYER